MMIVEEKEKEKITSKQATTKGHATRYSCLYSTMPDKRRAPPRV